VLHCSDCPRYHESHECTPGRILVCTSKRRGLGDRHRITLSSSVAVLLLFLACACRTTYVPMSSMPPQDLSQRITAELRAQATFGTYVARTYRGTDTARGWCEVYHGSNQVYFERGFCFDIGGVGQYSNPLVAMGEDVTGDGNPNLVVRHWMGSAKGHARFLVFEIGNEFKRLAAIDAPGPGDFKDVNGDGVLEFVTSDDVFALWDGCCYADSPRPKLVLRYSDGEYRLAQDCMLLTQSRATLLKSSATLTGADPAWNKGHPPIELTRRLVELMYGGHCESAWRLLESAWPADVQGLDAYRRKLEQAVERSQFWPQVRELCEVNDDDLE
jgi:hypothetical protein